MARMASITISVSESISSDLVDLIEHRLAVPSGMTVSEVYEHFQKEPHEFMAVTDGERMLGMVSRGQVGFLLGARFGVAVYGRKPIGEHLLPQHLCIRRGTPLLEVFEAALSRQGDYFYDDAALVDEAGHYLGMISVQTLVRLQTQMIAEQVRLAEAQRLELQEKNQQLFRSVNELRQSRGRYDILFENSALGVGLLDRHGAIETCNERLEHLLGIELASDRARRLSLADMIQPGERERFTELLHQLEMLPPAAAPNGGEFHPVAAGPGPAAVQVFSELDTGDRPDLRAAG